MDKAQSDLGFRLMAFSYKLRDLFRPRMDILMEVEIGPGYCVLDYGCGPGGYIPSVAELVGESGKIYALDIHPLAVQMVQDIASKSHLANVVTVLSDCETGLPDNSVDVALLYDTFHVLSKPDEVLKELHRVLRPNGVLSFSDHHMEEEAITSAVEKTGLYKLLRKGKRTHSFSKEL